MADTKGGWQAHRCLSGWLSLTGVYPRCFSFVSVTRLTMHLCTSNQEPEKRRGVIYNETQTWGVGGSQGSNDFFPKHVDRAEWIIQGVVRTLAGMQFQCTLAAGHGEKFRTRSREETGGKKLHSPVRHLGPKHHIQLQLKFFIKGTLILYFWSFTANQRCIILINKLKQLETFRHYNTLVHRLQTVWALTLLALQLRWRFQL